MPHTHTATIRLYCSTDCPFCGENVDVTQHIRADPARYLVPNPPPIEATCPHCTITFNLTPVWTPAKQ